MCCAALPGSLAPAAANDTPDMGAGHSGGTTPTSTGSPKAPAEPAESAAAASYSADLAVVGEARPQVCGAAAVSVTAPTPEDDQVSRMHTCKLGLNVRCEANDLS